MSDAKQQLTNGHSVGCPNDWMTELGDVNSFVVVDDDRCAAKRRHTFGALEADNAEIAKSSEEAVSESCRIGAGRILYGQAAAIPRQVTDLYDVSRYAEQVSRKKDSAASCRLRILRRCGIQRLSVYIDVYNSLASHLNCLLDDGTGPRRDDYFGLR